MPAPERRVLTYNAICDEGARLAREGYTIRDVVHIFVDDYDLDPDDFPTVKAIAYQVGIQSQVNAHPPVDTRCGDKGDGKADGRPRLLKGGAQ